MSISQNTACRRLSSLGIKQEIVHSYLNLISKWSRNEGVEHTITRLKKLKVAFIRRLANQEPDLSWIAHKGDLPKGPLRKIFQLRKPQKALSALMAYTEFVAKDITTKQLNKFMDSVHGPEEIDTSLVTFLSMLKLSSVGYSDMYTFPITGNVPNISGVGSRKNPTHECVRDVRRLPDVESFVLANRDRLVHSGFTSVGEVVTLHFRDFDHPLPMGRIGFIQEPGYKLRAVANPHRGLQYLLQPLKSALLKKLRTVTCDCTFDQEKGWLWAQSHLKSGHKVGSVDLSDATNLFPLSLQIELLLEAYEKDPFMKDVVHLFEHASTQPWVISSSLDSRGDPCTTTWTKGQPLGLGPSFPSFALSHHFVMWKVHNNLGLCPSLDGASFDVFLKGDYDYRILGDDIVMDGSLEGEYRSFMASLGCRISEDKCLSSYDAAEFASRVVTHDEILLQTKWKLTSDRNFMDLVKNLGPKYVKHLRPRQRKVVEAVAMLPESLGGLGWNPKGIPLSVRSAAAPFILKVAEDQMVHSVSTQASHNFYRDTPDICQGLIVKNEDWTLRLDANLKCKVKEPNRNLKDYLISSFKFLSEKVKKSEVIPEGYTLMDVTTDPRGITQLDSYENRLVHNVDEVLFSGSEEEILEDLVFLEEYESVIEDLIPKSVKLSECKDSNEPKPSRVKNVVERTFKGMTL